MKEAAAAALQQRAAASDLTLAYEVRCGDAADEILAVDAQLRPDLIVLATHGRRGLARFVMGSVTVRVLENARADVLAVRRDRDEE
jgi:nucleotide-binding universal stress UspA family protein